MNGNTVDEASEGSDGRKMSVGSYTLLVQHRMYRVFDILLLLLLIGVRCARPGESKNTLSVQRPQPHTTNPWKEEKDKTVGDKKKEQIMPTGKQ